MAFDEFADAALFAKGDAELRPMKDADYGTLRANLERLGFKGAVGPELVKAAVRSVLDENAVDSAMQWVGDQVWDGVPRIDEFAPRYLRTADTPYSRGVGRYLWTALAGRALSPGCRVDMSPVLVGGQGVGKTRAVAAIAPWPEAFAELDLSHRDADLARSVRGKLVVELGELRGLRTKDAEAIKSWLSRTVDEFVPKYVEFATRLPRRFVTIGTTNENDFLADATGERRWLPIDVGKVDVEAIERDRIQLWAEGAVAFAEHGVAWQAVEDLAPAEHEAFKSVDPWEGRVLSWLLVPVPDAEGVLPATRRLGEIPVQLSKVLSECLGMPGHVQHAGHTRRLAAVLRRLGFEKRRGADKRVFSQWHAVPGGRFDQAVKAGEPSDEA
jgi:predicted P-loop ATPase